MQEAQTQTLPAASSALRPFQKAGRYRDAEVEQQILRLQGCSLVEFWRRARQRSPQSDDYVKPEALVYLLREKRRAGDEKAAWDIVELLIERCAARIYRLSACWRLLSTQHIEDCTRDAQILMLEQLIDLEGGNEFWEANFTWCLQCLVQNVAKKYRRIAEAELSPQPLEDDEGHTTDFFDRIADTRSASPFQRAELAEALARLPEEERITLILFHGEGWSQQEIAAHFHITDRTVRNRLTNAQRRLTTLYSNE